jgi:RND family efflux transporter MFP subunit
MRRRALSLLCVCLPALLFLVGCSHKEPPPATEAPAVTWAHPITRVVEDYAYFTGRTEAVDSVEVRARVTGFLDHIRFFDGHEVQKGDLLFEIDPRPYKAELDRLQGQIDLARESLTLAQANYARAQSLANTISVQELETYRAKAGEARAALNAANANAETARLNLSFCKIIAPISGRANRAVSKELGPLTVGNLIVQDVTPMATIVAQSPLYVTFDVDERTILEVQERIRQGKYQSPRDKVRDPMLLGVSSAGLLASPAAPAALLAATAAYPGKSYNEVPVGVALETDKGYPHHGHIDFIDNQVNAATATIRVRAFIPNEKQVMTPGLFVRVRVSVGPAAKALLVPDEALGTNQGQKFVYVIDDKNEVARRTVTLGPKREGLRVIDSGLEATDRVIIDGLVRVRPGAVVEPKEGQIVPEKAD